MQIAIIDTGTANIASVKFALTRLDANIIVTADPQAIQQADKVVLPGVGSAINAMQSINERGLAPVIQQLTQPTLGVCLGMQLMLSQSAEAAWQSDASIPCLDLLPGTVSRMMVGERRLPHMGWNQITPVDHVLFDGIPAGSYFYFVHSFCVPLANYTLASCDYGQAFSAAIGRDNFYGVQFHPERSGKAGLQLLQNFVTKVST